MKGDELLNAIEHIDADLIEAADGPVKKRKKPYWVAAVAAVLAVVIGISPFHGRNDTPIIDSTATVPSFSTIDLFAHNVHSENISGPQSAEYIYYNEKFYGTPANVDKSFPCAIVVEARVTEVLPDIYSITYDGESYHVLVMETLDVLNCENVPKNFFLRIPKDYSTVISQYDSIILSMVQSGFEDFIMINESTSSAEFFSLMFELPYRREWVSILTFSNGVWDPSIRDLGKWNVPLYKLVREGTTVEECKNNLRLYFKSDLSDSYSDYGDSNSIRNVYTQATFCHDHLLEFKKIIDNGVFYQTQNWSDNYVRYTRLINGFQTSEDIIVRPNGVQFSPAPFTQEDITNAPDMSAIIEKLKADLSSFASPHADFYAGVNATLTSSSATGKYFKVSGQVYGVVKIAWEYYIIDDHYASHHYTDSLYYVLSESDSCQTVEREELLKLLGSDDFIEPPYDYGIKLGMHALHK